MAVEIMCVACGQLFLFGLSELLPLLTDPSEGPLFTEAANPVGRACCPHCAAQLMVTVSFASAIPRPTRMAGCVQSLPQLHVTQGEEPEA